MWYSNDMFHDMLKMKFVTLVSLKVPSGDESCVYFKSYPVANPYFFLTASPNLHIFLVGS